jgi:hypothetical protein
MVSEPDCNASRDVEDASYRAGAAFSERVITAATLAWILRTNHSSTAKSALHGIFVVGTAVEFASALLSHKKHSELNCPQAFHKKHCNSDV